MNASASPPDRSGLKPPMIERKAVLISGASSGIGEAAARELIAHGFRVYAGVRTAADADRLGRELGTRCTPLLLDVTDATSIAAAAGELRAAGGIYGLVNNAGIAVAAPLEFLPLPELRRQFEVNVFGAVAVTQAMLPLLRRSLGRVINVGSIAGRTALPIAGPYGASKAALDMLTQTLRMELAPFDILVSYIEPGSHRTPIWERSRRAAIELEAALSPLSREYYAAPIDGMRTIANIAERNGDDPVNIARAIAGALESPHPRARYTIGKDTRARFLLSLLPQHLKERFIRRRIASAARA